ncbi:hypothetical protein HYU93_01610 [Candidatus Daviesbacteria bacterium]|nr:hypothetical protein [Candidatus Daviesbacteria bacterium]
MADGSNNYSPEYGQSGVWQGVVKRFPASLVNRFKPNQATRPEFPN